MAAAPSPWPHRTAATETRYRIRAKQDIQLLLKHHGDPCSVRLHGNLILCHGSLRDITVRELDHRAEVADVATLTCVEACSELIHSMLAEAPATSQYDVAANNWVDSVHTPLDIAEEIANCASQEVDDDEGLPVQGLDIDIHLDLMYSELCAVCLVDSETGPDEAVELPCSHLFHSGCIARWFSRASTCPTCRREIPEPFISSVRSASDEVFMQIGAEDESFIATELQLLDDESEDEDDPEEFVDSVDEEDRFVEMTYIAEEMSSAHHAIE